MAGRCRSPPPPPIADDDDGQRAITRMVKYLLVVAATTTLLSVVAAVQGAPDTSNKAVGLLLTCHHGERGVCLSSGTPLLLRPDGGGGGGNRHRNSFTSTTADECCAQCRKYNLRTPPIPTPCASFTFNETDRQCDLYAPSAHIEKTYSTECTSGGAAAVGFDILRSLSTPRVGLATKYATLSRELGPDPSTARLLPTAAVAHRALQSNSNFCSEATGLDLNHMHEVPCSDGSDASICCGCDQGFYAFLPDGTPLSYGRDVCFRCSGFPHMQPQGTSCNCDPGYYINIPEYTKISCPVTMQTHCCLPCTRFPNKHEMFGYCVCDNGFPLSMEGGCKKCSEIPHARGTTTCSCAPGYFWNEAGDKCIIEDMCPGPSDFGPYRPDPYKDCAAIKAGKCSPGMLEDLQDPALCAELYKSGDHSLTYEECVVLKQQCPSTCPKKRVNTKGKCDQGNSCSWGTDVDDCYNSRCPDGSHVDGSKCTCDSNAKMNITNAAPMTCDRDCEGHYSACTPKCESALQRKWITTVTPAGHGQSCAAAQTLVPRKSCDCSICHICDDVASIIWIIAIGAVLAAVLTYLTRCMNKRRQTSRLQAGLFGAESGGGWQTTVSTEEPTGVTVESSNPTSLAGAEHLSYSLN
eukprot:COSAG01_NODE_1573_length_9865_cov_132.568503_7_plen_635_part_00